MTKLLTPIILLTLLLSFFSTGVSAHDIEVKNAEGVTIYYNWINNNTEVAVSYRGENVDSYKKEYSGNVVIPESIIYNGNSYKVTSIGKFAFDSCSGLTSVSIPNSITSIDYSAFTSCSGLTSVTFPNSVNSIGERAFSYCSGLISVTIPNSVNSIGKYAFWGCSGLTFVTIPYSVTYIGDNSFSGCSGLISIVVESGNSMYDSRDNCNAIIETQSSKLSVGCNNTIIPNSVTSIGKGAFEGCTLTSVTIPNSVTYIDIGAFWGCKSLTSVTIPNSVTSIGERAFYNCSDLTSVTIGKSVTSIGSEAFAVCSSLASVTIPNSVTSIGRQAFYYCNDLTSVTIGNSVTSIGDQVFLSSNNINSVISKIQHPFEIVSCFEKSIYSKATLTVPQGTKAAYQATTGWKNFVNIVEEGATDEILFTIDGTTYQGSSSNKTAQVKSVDTKLRNLEIPATVNYNGTNYQVTGVADNAFSGSTMAALIWNADGALPSNAFSNASIGSNFLLYVKSASYAPSSVKNVVVNGTAQSIVLSDDGGQFYCPQSFIANNISYSHNYNMETGGNGKGWETITLPFDVQKITHSSNGEIVPFASYDAKSNQKPFWLYEYSGRNFLKASSIRANKAYLIAMPNQTSYKKEYNLSGDVTFSAENVRIPVTPEASGAFVPTFSKIEKSNSIKVLNVVNKYVNETGGFDAGSRFISNLRNVRPFECYLKDSGSTRSVDDMIVDNKR